MALNDQQREYWSKNLQLTAGLLAIWFVVTFVMAYFARPLSEISFFGWPLSFYMAAQGCLIIYLVIIFLYMRRMRKLDQQYEVSEGDEA